LIKDLIAMWIEELAPRINSKIVSPVDLTEAVLNQVESIAEEINSY